MNCTGCTPNPTTPTRTIAARLDRAVPDPSRWADLAAEANRKGRFDLDAAPPLTAADYFMAEYQAQRGAARLTDPGARSPRYTGDMVRTASMQLVIPATANRPEYVLYTETPSSRRDVPAGATGVTEVSRLPLGARLANPQWMPTPGSAGTRRS